MFGPPSRDRPALLQLMAISWNFGWPVAAGVILGNWVDGKLGSSPAAALTFGLGAMVTAVWRLIALGKQDAVEREHESHKDTGER
jgi:hypothetical protein